MSKLIVSVLCFTVACASLVTGSAAQEAKTDDSATKPAASAANKSYSGMYTFLKEGEFVQLTVEDEGRVTGFISRYGDGESDKGAFLDQFFKNGKLEGAHLTFKTELVHGVDYDFKGTVERGPGTTPNEDGYFILKGTLTQNVSDVNKKVTSHSREVEFKSFPQDAAPVAAGRK